MDNKNIKAVEEDVKNQSELLAENMGQTIINATNKVAPMVVQAVDKIEGVPKTTDDALNKTKGAQK